MRLVLRFLLVLVLNIVYGEAASYAERSLVADQGRSLGEFYHTDLPACKKLCDEEAMCKSFTFKTRPGDCHLKDKIVTDEDPASHYDHGKDGLFATFYEQSGGYVAIPLVASEGTNVGDFTGVGLEICKSKCDSTSGCKSFSYETEAGDCHLKDKKVTELDPASEEEHGKDGSFVTYFRSGAVTYKERTLVAREGRSVGDFYGLGFADCESKCRINPKCKSFAFQKKSDGECRLKDKKVTKDSPASKDDDGASGLYLTYFKIDFSAARQDREVEPSKTTARSQEQIDDDALKARQSVHDEVEHETFDDVVTEEDVLLEIDKDGDKQISMTEVFEFLHSQSEGEEDPEKDKKIFEKTFKSSDKDGDGFITVKELPDMMNSIHKAYSGGGDEL